MSFESNQGSGGRESAGREVNNYVLKELIGSGGMSKVWRARAQGEERDLAVKVVPIEDLAPDFERRLRREPEIHHSLRHPNIVPLLDWFRQGDEFFLVMEYVPGMPLSRRLQSGSGPLSFEVARRYMGGLLDAVAYLHDNGIIHRDIKPGNVLIDPNDRVKLTDFGIAKFSWQQGETRTQKGLGTPEYMSPEQVRGIGIDLRTDIYSLGITLFEMLTGRKPFVRGEETPAHFAEVVGKILNEPLPDPRQFRTGLPDGVTSLIRKATAKRPEDRFSTCAEFRDALDAVDATEITPFHDPDATVVLGADSDRDAAGSSASARKTGSEAPPGPARARIDRVAAQEHERNDPERSSRRGILIVVLLLLLAAGGYAGSLWYDATMRERNAAPLTDQRAREIAEELRADYERFSFDGNIAGLTTLYATEGVDYFRMNNVGREEIATDAEKFFAKIVRTDRFDVEIARVNRQNDSTLTTRWVITYERQKDDGTILRGEAVHDLTVRRIDGDWLIVRERQQAIRRNNEAPPPPDSTAADTTVADESPVDTEEPPSPPSEQNLRDAVKSIILLANNGQSAQAWDQYASASLKGSMNGFPAPIPDGSLSLRTVSVDGSRVTASMVQSRGFASTEWTLSLTFSEGEGLKLTSVSVTEQ